MTAYTNPLTGRQEQITDARALGTVEQRTAAAKFETRSSRTGARVFVVRCCNWSTGDLTEAGRDAAAPVSVQRWVQRIYDDPANPDDDHCDHISHRVFVHGETPLICFPVRRPGGADGVLADDWQAITDTLRDTHAP